MRAAAPKPAPRSLASDRIGGYDYPRVVKVNCRVCQYRDRRWVEEQLVAGRPPKAVCADIPDSGLTARNVADHLRRGHLPVEHRAVQKLQHEVAQDVAALVDQGADSLVLATGLARTVLGRVAAGVGDDTVKPTVADAFRAVKFLERMGSETPGFDKDLFLYAINRILEVFEPYLERDQFDSALKQLNDDQDLKECYAMIQALPES